MLTIPTSYYIHDLREVLFNTNKKIYTRIFPREIDLKSIPITQDGVNFKSTFVSKLKIDYTNVVVGHDIDIQIFIYGNCDLDKRIKQIINELETSVNGINQNGYLLMNNIFIVNH